MHTHVLVHSVRIKNASNTGMDRLNNSNSTIVLERYVWLISEVKYLIDTLKMSLIWQSASQECNESHIFSCCDMNCPFSYLGLPLGGNPRTTKFWEPVIENVSKRLGGWKGAYFSLGGGYSYLSHVCLVFPLIIYL